ncbi:hypothetical protein EVAR_28730_1 [Eumeta japonica]|uniref:Uncharacterized protein n=1 Tax=Eumeta variegata TaxID=151549 RepID=A0A4C1V6C9_EUMVA|nr:hypothetical protein EVAR_28730_1 [Eumeta japonica]
MKIDHQSDFGKETSRKRAFFSHWIPICVNILRVIQYRVHNTSNNYFALDRLSIRDVDADRRARTARVGSAKIIRKHYTGQSTRRKVTASGGPRRADGRVKNAPGNRRPAHRERLTGDGALDNTSVTSPAPSSYGYADMAPVHCLEGDGKPSYSNIVTTLVTNDCRHSPSASDQCRALRFESKQPRAQEQTKVKLPLAKLEYSQLLVSVSETILRSGSRSKSKNAHWSKWPVQRKERAPQTVFSGKLPSADRGARCVRASYPYGLVRADPRKTCHAIVLDIVAHGLNNHSASESVTETSLLSAVCFKLTFEVSPCGGDKKMYYPRTRVRGGPTLTDQNPEATCWLVVVRSPINWNFEGLHLSRPIGMGCRRRVIALWMPQGGHLGIGITWRFSSGLTSSRVPGAREAHRLDDHLRS